MHVNDMQELEPAVPDLDVRHALALIGDYVVSSMTEEEVPGIVAALRCILSTDTMDAADVVIELRAHTKREEQRARLRNWVLSESIYRAELSRPLPQSRGVIQYVECRDVQDVVEHFAGTVPNLKASDVREVRVIDARRADPDRDLEELIDIEEQGW